MFSLLKPTFSLLFRPTPLSLNLHSTAERSPTDNLNDYPTASADGLVPLIFGARLLDQ
jgi:hypothetical protein